MSEPEEINSQPKTRLGILAKGESPIGKAYKFCLDRNRLLGDLATGAVTCYFMTGFNAFLDATDNPELIARLDIVIDSPSKSSDILDELVVRSAFEELKEFYRVNFGDPSEFPDAFMNFLQEISIHDITSNLKKVCYEHRRLDLS